MVRAVIAVVFRVGGDIAVVVKIGVINAVVVAKVDGRVQRGW